MAVSLMSIYLTCFKYNKLCVSNQVVLPQLRRSRFPTLFVILHWRPFCSCRMHGCRYPQRGGGLAVAEDARHRGHIRAAKAEAEQDAGYDTAPQRTWWEEQTLADRFICETAALVRVYEVLSGS